MAVPNSRQSKDELRCHCGSLMARVTARGIELKCRRCKRVVVLVADQTCDEWVRVSLHGGVPMTR